MASAVRSRSPNVQGPEGAGAPPDPGARRALRRARLVGTSLFSVPFVVSAIAADGARFVSNTHATSVAKALFAVDRRHYELLGIVYPPGPFALATVHPRTITLSILGAACGGAIAWAFWRFLAATTLPLPARLAAFASVLLTPATVYLATQSFGDIAALGLILWAWALVQGFVLRQRTSMGFAAGLLLGVAFYFSLITFVYAVAIAMLAPVYHALRPAGADDDAEAAARAWATLFPTLIAFGSWAYLNWLFIGDPLAILRDRSAPIRSAILADVAADTHPLRGILTTIVDLSGAPLYLGIGVLLAMARPRILPAYLTPVILVGLLRSLGFAYPVPFAVVTLLFVGLAAMRSLRDTRVTRILLVVSAAAQILVGALLPVDDPELRTWQHAITSGEARRSDAWEVAIAAELRELSPRSMLVDDRSAYRLLARVATARPFLLPADAAFDAAVSSPSRYVRYVLVARGGLGSGDELTKRYANRDPPGFLLDAQWPGWRLYRRGDTEPLLASTGAFRLDGQSGETDV